MEPRLSIRRSRHGPPQQDIAEGIVLVWRGVKYLLSTLETGVDLRAGLQLSRTLHECYLPVDRPKRCHGDNRHHTFYHRRLCA